MSAIVHLPCGCTVQRVSENVERVFRMCDGCAQGFNERHVAAAAHAAESRAKLWAEESHRYLA